MAGKTTAKSPRSTPKSASKARPEAVATPVTSANADGEDSKTEAATEPESVTVTPARRSSKRKAAEDATPAAGHLEKDGETTTTPSSKKPKVYAQESVSVTESAGRKHTHRTVKVEIPVSTTPTNGAKPAGKHIVFDNDNDEEGHSEFFTPQEAPAGKSLDALLPKGGEEEEEEKEDDDDDDDEDDSDDDAPEAVSTQTAAAHAAKSADAATKAAEKQEELQKRKRQERDARLKEQAEARKRQQQKAEQKQRRKDKKAAAHAAAEKGDGEGDSEDEADEARPEQQQQQRPRRDHIASLTSSAPTRKRLDKRSLPAVLPDDFLDFASDDDDAVPGGDGEEEDDAARERAAKRRRSAFNTASRKVARAETRQPVDQRVGATVYRVMRRQGDDRLAPRAAKYSRNAKEALLGRGRPAGRKAGFVVKKR
ncbi:hypothetical protein VPNG_03311 [Cytospora leucostoma]|uniref:Uncharacterized protein n=1 Tax=Cytospora leucostoma TaxID=1230097 RepID=A0A423XFE1_9PEZI|nr:hypothetical protein VPNG_03311 [Cytospora leucostoma]